MAKAPYMRLIASCGCLLVSSSFAWGQDDEPTAAPGPTSFATDPSELGALANSINLFTGQVILPIPLVSLPGRDGLAVAVAASYSSAGGDLDVKTWNRDAPTGILGLGWNLDYPRIVADHKGTGTVQDDEFYLIGGGSSSELIFSGEVGSNRLFTAQGSPFQEILYYPSDQRWEITDESGTISTYGGQSDANSNVQWAVRWGNYAGNSTVSSNQTQFPIAWNLSKVESRTGSTIHYDYLAITRRVGSGSGTKVQTEASYLQKITDTLGRTVTFVYGDKSSGEYVEPHTETLGGQESSTTGDAYQEQYETKFLDRIEVNSEHDVRLFSLEMGYSSTHLNQCGASCDKRLLTSITHLNADGDALPSIDFAYTTSGSRAGFLNDVTTTSGAQLEYEYVDQSLDHSQLDLTINAPSGYKEPRVWIGEDYVVVSWRKPSPSNGDVKIRAYRWEGEWFEDASFPTFRAERLETDRQDFDVHIERDFFAVVAETPSNDVHQLFLYHKDETSRNGWEASSGIEVWEYEQDTDRVATGNGFAATVFDDAGFKKIVTLSWNGEAWLQQEHRTVYNSSVFQIAGGPDYFAALEGANPTSFTIFFRDVEGLWNESTGPTLSGVADEYQITPGPTFVGVARDVFTHYTYLYTWDENFSTVSHTSQLSNSPSPEFLVGGASTVGLVASGASGITVKVARYDGANWDVYDFTPSQTQGAGYFSFGEDYAVRRDQSGQGGQRLRYDANNSGSPNWISTLTSLPSSDPYLNEEFPRAGIGNHLLGRDAYFRSPSAWGNEVQLPLSGAGIDTKSTRQAGSVGVVYETDGGTQGDTIVLPIRNGIFQEANVLDHGRVRNTGGSGYLDRSELVGPGTIVTFPRSVSTDLFHTATELTLYRLVNDDLSGSQQRPVVSRITTNDGYEDRIVEYDYELALSTIDASGKTPQFNKVVVTPRDPDNMALEPAGHVEHHFFTGYEGDGAHPSEDQLNASLQDSFPDGNDNSLQFRSLIQGLPYSVRSYDAGGLVSNARTIWTVFETWAGDPPDDDNRRVRFIRPSATFVELTPSVLEQGSVSVYSNSGSTGEIETGLVERTYTLDQTTGGGDIVVETDLTYWWEQYDTDRSEHLYSPVVAARTKVGTVVVSSTATKWEDDWDGAFSDWAPGESFTWLGTGGTGASVFSAWTSTPSSDWLRTSLITQRDDYGNVLEVEDVEGRPGATKYEHEGGLAVASFTNARANETFADDFDDRNLNDGEPDEWNVYDTGWTLDGTLHWTDVGNPGRVTASNPIDQVDFIAEFSIRVDETDPFVGFQFRKVQPTDHYNTSGYTLKFEDDGTLNLHHAQRGLLEQETWTLRPHDWHRVRLACNGQYIRVYVDGELVIYHNDTGFTPTGTYAGFRFVNSAGQVDDFRMYPLDASASSTSYDRDLRRANHQVGVDGRWTYLSYDNFSRLVETRRDDGLVMGEVSAYRSRVGSGSGFSPAEPDASYVRAFRFGNPVENGSFERGDAYGGGLIGWPIWSGDHVDRRDAIYTSDAPTGGFVMEVEAASNALPWSNNHGYLYDKDYFQPEETYTMSFWARCMTGTCDYIPRIMKHLGDGALAVASGPQGTITSSWQRYSITLTAGIEDAWSDPTNRSLVRIDTWKNSVIQFDDVQVVRGAEPVYPAVGVVFADASGKAIQTQSYDGNAHIVSATLYDALGRGHVTTKPVRYNDAVPGFGLGIFTPGIFDHITNFANLNPGTFQMTGLVDDVYPEDEGFPYSRTVYESSPLGRPLEEGGPGDDLRVGSGNSTRYTYVREQSTGTLTQQLGLGGEHIRIEVSSPDEVNSFSLTDRSGRSVGSRGHEIYAQYFEGGVTTVNESNAEATFAVQTQTVVPYSADFYIPIIDGHFYIGTSSDASDIVDFSFEDAAGDVDTTGSFTAYPGITYYVEIDGHADPTLSGELYSGSVTHGGFVVGNIEPLSRIIRDAYGNVTQSRPPGYYHVPTTSTSQQSDYATTRTYDHLGQVLTETTPDGGWTEFVYNEAGRLRFAFDESGDRIPPAYDAFKYWKYDDRGRVIEEGIVSQVWDRAYFEQHAEYPTWPSTSLTWRRQFIYGADYAAPHLAGRVSSVLTNNDGDIAPEVTESYKYTVEGDLEQVDLIVDEDGQGLLQNPDAVVAYTYDDAGNMLTVAYPEGIAVYYERDEQGRTVSIGSAMDPDLYASYTYGTWGEISSEVIDNGRVTRTNTVDGLGRLTGIGYDDDGLTTLFQETITYGAADDCGGKNRVGRITAAESEIGFAGSGEDFTVTYCYDKAGRLNVARHTSSDAGLNDYDLGRYQEPLRYDANGNLVRMSRGTPSGGSMESHSLHIGTNRLANTFDVAGNESFLYHEYNYDPAGRLTSDGERGLTLSQDLFFERPLELAVTYGPTANFMYGASDRVFKMVTEGTGRSEILYGRGPDNSPLFEREQNFVSDVLMGQELTFYIYGPGGMVAKEVRTGLTPPSAGPVSFYVKDHLGSTRAVLASGTGTVEASYDYSPFGEVMRASVAVESRYTYTGQESDGESGLMNYHARLYDPSIGRFGATDPAGQFNSPYAYVGNNPVSFTDPSGEFVPFLTGIVVGAAIGAALSGGHTLC